MPRQSHLANLMYDAPANPREARSLPCRSAPGALALERRRVTLADFTADALRDPELREVAMTRVTAVSIPLPENRAPTQVVRNHDDRKVDPIGATAVVAPRGHIDNPLTEDERWAKFDLCCACILTPQRRDTLIAALKDFDSDAPASAVMRPLRP